MRLQGASPPRWIRWCERHTSSTKAGEAIYSITNWLDSLSEAINVNVCNDFHNYSTIILRFNLSVLVVR